MRWVRRILGAIVLLVVALVGIAYLLPREVSVARSTVIDAPPEAVFGHINSLQAGAEWSPWLGIDPDIELAYSGPEEGVGNALAWTSEHPDVGSGAQEIVESVANEKVVTDLNFGDMGTAKATFLLAPEGEGTKVTWGFVADMGMNPMGRWMGLMMDGFVGPDYETGLSNLKGLVEGT